MKKQSENFLSYLKRHLSIIEWNKERVITHHGQELDKSNLTELFHLFFYVNKKINEIAPG